MGFRLLNRKLILLGGTGKPVLSRETLEVHSTLRKSMQKPLIRLLYTFLGRQWIR